MRYSGIKSTCLSRCLPPRTSLLCSGAHVAPSPQSGPLPYASFGPLSAGGTAPAPSPMTSVDHDLADLIRVTIADLLLLA